MPPLTAELAGVAAVIAGLLVIAVVVDPRLRARRAANRLARIRRHAAAGCIVCRQELIIIELDAEVAAQREKLDRLAGRIGGTR